jgi:hypothetical protein
MSIYLLIAIAVVIIIGIMIIPKHYPYLEEVTEQDIYIGLDFSKHKTRSDCIVVTLRAYDDFNEACKEAVLAAEKLKELFLQPSIGGGIFIEDNPYFGYYDMFLTECNTEEFTPFEAGRIAYGLGKGEEDNPYRYDEELGVEWEAGYCEAFRLDREN